MTVTEERTTLDRTPKGLFVGGGWREAADGAVLPVHDPATGDVLAEVADAAPVDALAALDEAAAAQAGWAARAPRERAELLRRAFELAVERAESLALLVTLEMGKPLADARAEVAYGAEFLRWFSEEACRVGGSYRVAPAGTTRLVTMRQPVGPVLAITPWNFPLAMATRKLAPALAAGCTVVLKPAGQTPLTALAFAQVLADAGLPAGVVAVLPTSRAADVGRPLLADRRLRKLTFTGSTAVGRQLAAASAANLLRVSLELGGNAPFLVFDDADLDAAVDGAMVAKLRSNGEACTAANRFLVHTPVADEFARRLAARMAAVRVGRGTEAGVELGPLIDGPARDGVHELVAGAVAAGARVLTGAEPVGERGWFYAPTVLADVPAGSPLLHDEVFGPVAPITTFADEAAALALANDTEYGLAGYVFTGDLSRAVRVAEGLETGMVGLNTGLVSNPAAPFGGIKHSGVGREGGAEGIDEYLEVKYVAVAT